MTCGVCACGFDGLGSGVATGSTAILDNSGVGGKARQVCQKCWRWVFEIFRL